MKKLIAAKRIQPLNDIQDRVYLIIFSLTSGNYSQERNQMLIKQKTYFLFIAYLYTVSERPHFINKIKTPHSSPAGGTFLDRCWVMA